MELDPRIMAKVKLMAQNWTSVPCLDREDMEQTMLTAVISDIKKHGKKWATPIKQQLNLAIGISKFCLIEVKRSFYTKRKGGELKSTLERRDFVLENTIPAPDNKAGKIIEGLLQRSHMIKHAFGSLFDPAETAVETGKCSYADGELHLERPRKMDRVSQISTTALPCTSDGVYQTNNGKVHVTNSVVLFRDFEMVCDIPRERYTIVLPKKLKAVRKLCGSGASLYELDTMRKKVLKFIQDVL